MKSTKNDSKASKTLDLRWKNLLPTQTNRSTQAKTTLLEAYKLLSAGLGDDHDRTVKTASRLIKLYESWNPAEPGKGYDTKATEWRAKLPKIEKSEQPEP